MPVTSDIAATYRRPRGVFRRLFEMQAGEERALKLVFAGCIMMFIAQMPRLVRGAYLQGYDPWPGIGSTLAAWVFVAPLMLYALSYLSYLILRAFGGKCPAIYARLTLFWAFLAASPLVLLHGLVAGYTGPGGALNVVGALWLAVFVLFWLAGLREAGWGRA